MTRISNFISMSYCFHIIMNLQCNLTRTKIFYNSLVVWERGLNDRQTIEEVKSRELNIPNKTLMECLKTQVLWSSQM